MVEFGWNTRKNKSHHANTWQCWNRKSQTFSREKNLIVSSEEKKPDDHEEDSNRTSATTYPQLHTVHFTNTSYNAEALLIDLKFDAACWFVNIWISIIIVDSALSKLLISCHWRPTAALYLPSPDAWDGASGETSFHNTSGAFSTNRLHFSPRSAQTFTALG